MFGFAAKDAATLAWNGDAKVFVVALVIALAAGVVEAAQGLGLVASTRVALARGAAVIDVARHRAGTGKTNAFIYFQF